MDITSPFSPLFQKASVLHHQGKYKAAIGIYLECLSCMPNHADLLSNLGSALVSISQEQTAEAYFKQGLYVKKSHPKLLTNYGNLLRKQGRFVEAEVLYKRLLEHQPKKKEHLLLAGMLYCDWHKPQLALHYFHKVHKIDPEY